MCRYICDTTWPTAALLEYLNVLLEYFVIFNLKIV